MIKTKTFLPDNSETMEYDSGHWYLKLKAMNSLKSEEVNINFVCDTGASIVTINPRYFEMLKIAESGIETTPAKTNSYGSSILGKTWILPT
ncbi:MAG: hypothetical protein FWG68_03385 [Defluviitaleaceae bacterium]|nr:hypothetical protein [Defluviitaleaceae bacterium]